MYVDYYEIELAMGTFMHELFRAEIDRLCAEARGGIARWCRPELKVKNAPAIVNATAP